MTLIIMWIPLQANEDADINAPDINDDGHFEINAGPEPQGGYDF